MKYRDNMTEEEKQQLLAEIEALDAIYATVEIGNALEDEQSLDYFNRYIAGDR